MTENLQTSSVSKKSKSLARVLENLEIVADLEASVALSITMNGNTEHLDTIGGEDRPESNWGV